MNRPNILWICTDQQRLDTIGALGNSHARTPNLDRLCAAGTVFRNAYCQSPVCTPSRSSFLTGWYPGTIGAGRNNNDQWPERADLLPRLLRDGPGYDCGLVGKLHLAGAYQRETPDRRVHGVRVFEPEVRPRDDGYRVFQWSHSPFDDWGRHHAYANWVRARGFDLGELRRRGESIPAECHQTTFCADTAIEYVTGRLASPWLVSMNPFDPHPPFDPPTDYLARFDPAAMPSPAFRSSDLDAQAKLADVDFQSSAKPPDPVADGPRKAAYHAMIELIDENVGRVIKALEDSGQRDRTLIIFMSDHGDTLGDHGLWGKGCRFYEGLVRVPLVVSWPGRVREGVVSNALVELTDLVPTLMDVAGLDAPAGLPGRSLWSLLTGRAPAHRHREFVRCDYHGALNLGRGPRRSHGTMIRTAGWKLVLYHGIGLGELFNLEQDPMEFDNRWDDPACADRRRYMTSLIPEASTQEDDAV
ncbi:MAG: sulfatase-like hydrolase/transferase [Caldilineaceae bacterium]|nr:sulfatase-like hydrolase/transferase [Caldilineaceae bacterium]